MTTTRWLFGDQLGPQFVPDPDQPLLLVESTAVLRRHRFHRQKAHLVLSAMRHRAAELGDQVRYVRHETYGEGLRTRDAYEMVQPTSRSADAFVRSRGIPVLDEPLGFATTREEFAAFMAGRKAAKMEDFYRWQRVRLDVLMHGDEPEGGRWNLDHENREPPPKAKTLGLPEPWTAEEDEIDQEVRHDLDRWGIETIGVDAPRWAPATRAEALQALQHFVATRLPTFGAVEDAMLEHDPWMSHSALSPAINLGLLHPLEVVEAALEARADVPLASLEGFVRQVIGWREWMWHLYWHAGLTGHDALHARRHVPEWYRDLDPSDVQARCLKNVLTDLRDRGWVHHIPRLMVLGNYALQRGWDPAELTEWFHTRFVDGYDWVMLPNVTGMSQYADGGLVATKPYASGGAYLNRMSDYCGGCPYDPKKRVGEDACPFTAGYWAFLDRNRDRLAGNHRMRQPLAGLSRLSDLDVVVEQERRRGDDPP
jgi:deoxyribodipyrimidine photolyase-related protein